MPSDRGGSYDNPEDLEAIDPQSLPSLSMVDVEAPYQCDSCCVYYAHSGARLMRESTRSLEPAGGYRPTDSSAKETTMSTLAGDWRINAVSIHRREIRHVVDPQCRSHDRPCNEAVGDYQCQGVTEHCFTTRWFICFKWASGRERGTVWVNAPTEGEALAAIPEWVADYEATMAAQLILRAAPELDEAK